MKPLNIIRFKSNILLLPIVLIALTLGLNSCEKDMYGKIYQVSDQKMIDEILESKADSMSSFIKIIDKSGLRGTIHAYGAYTLFAPTNDAITRYLASKNLTLDNLTDSMAAEIVKYHLIADTIPSSEFVDGRLAMTNFSRKYITTQTIAEGGSVNVVVNRQATLLERDLRGGNGYLHIVSTVLSQSPNTVVAVVNNLDDSYSLFKEAFTKSGIENVINLVQSQIPDAAFTCFIQDNEAYAASGINTFDDLLVELRAKNTAITDDNVLLSNYMSYHLVSGFKYVVDLINLSSLQTLVSGEVIVLKKDITKVLLNEFLIGGVLEKGVEVDRTSTLTDLSCADGVIHKINGNIQIVKRNAFRVYWDIAEQPELMAMKNFRKAGANILIDNTDLEGITWAKTFATDKITYKCDGYPKTITKDNNYTYGDYFYFRLSTNTMKWIEFKTPVLVPGTYKVWFSYRGLSTVQQIRTIFKQTGQEDQVMGITSTTYNKTPSTYGLTAYDGEFFKKALLDGNRYQMINSQGEGGFWSNSNNCQALGIIQVYTTGQHVLRMEPLLSSQFTTWWDQILFIPIDEDQIWPKQDVAGKYIYENTPNCEIYPYSDCTVVDPETTTNN